MTENARKWTGCTDIYINSNNSFKQFVVIKLNLSFEWCTKKQQVGRKGVLVDPRLSATI